METVTKYAYKLADVRELVSTPEGATIDRTDLIIDLMMAKPQIITPQFLGVYQVKGPNNVKDLKRFERSHVFGFQITDTLLETRGIEDKIHPQLICIGYGEGWTRELVKMNFIDRLGRVVVYPAQSLPNFDEKTSMQTIEGMIERMQAEHMRDKIKVARDFKREIEDLTRERSKYGFTRIEQAFLETLSI